MELESNIIEIKNIGEQKARILNNMEIYTVKNLIEYFPRDYEDRSHIKKISRLDLNNSNTFRARVKAEPEVLKAGEKDIVQVKLYDETGSITAVWFNQKYIKKSFELGAEYIFTGKPVKKYGKLQIISPEFEKIINGVFFTAGRIMPVYPLTKGISQKVLRNLIEKILNETKNQLYDFIPIWVRKKYELCDRNFAVWNIHFPQSDENFFIARRRLVFEELFILQTALFKIKNLLNKDKKGLVIKDNGYSRKFIKSLPFKLTNAQNKVIDEIKNDMSCGKIMNRLIQGDVGSGKTAVAMAASFIAIKNGFQAVLMAPTEVLAEQHFESFKAVFEAFNIKTVLITGSMTKKERTAAEEEISSGCANMIIGTHTVIQKTIIFKKLGLVITDEQHRFGVRQREILTEKGNNPHILVMTATPIPRTLALILYGDLDISIINEFPPGRKKIDTFSVPPSYHERIYKFIKKAVENKHQAYIVCPIIEESETLELRAVSTYTQELKEIFKGFKVEYLHGKMKTTEKQLVMESFIKGEMDILVSTTVIEVGINVPNAVIMLIENAERFGLAQLHQLRGRVGRGSEQSYCILVCDSKNPVSKERMKVMEHSSDGFEISEKDLQLRGPGEFFGTKQHGLPEMKIANLYKDMDILKEAQQAANEIIEKDFKLENEENKLLLYEINKIFEGGSVGL